MQEGLAQERSNADAWNSAFDLYGQAFAQLDESQMDAFVAGVLATMEQMEQANEYLLVPVALDEANQALADSVTTVETEDLDASGRVCAALCGICRAAGISGKENRMVLNPSELSCFYRIIAKRKKNKPENLSKVTQKLELRRKMC